MIFVFPTEREAEKFRAKYPTAEVAICGVGLIESAATIAKLVKDSDKNDAQILLAGVAGAYNIEEFPIGTVVEVASEVVEELPKKYRKRYDITPRFGLKTASSNSVNAPFFEGAESQIENMEGAAAAAICQAFDIKFSEIRAISNKVGDTFEKWSIDEATDRLTNTLSIIYEKYNA